MLNSEFNQKNVNLLKSGPEEYSRFLKEYKAGLDKLLSGLPAKSPYIPEGFRELEAKNIYLAFNTLKLNYAIEHLREEGEASQFTPDETYFAFLKEIPFDNPEELKNLNYELLLRLKVFPVLRMPAHPRHQQRKQSLIGQRSFPPYGRPAPIPDEVDGQNERQ